MVPCVIALHGTYSIRSDIYVYICSILHSTFGSPVVAVVPRINLERWRAFSFPVECASIRAKNPRPSPFWRDLKTHILKWLFRNSYTIYMYSF